MTSVTRRDFLTATGALVAGTTLARASSAAAASAAAAGPAAASHSRAVWALPAKRPFRVIENDWIPLEGGTRLAVRLFIPEGAEQRPVPVVWEYLPYRKRDGVRKRDDATARNLAPYGIAFARIDIRGTGDSQGVMTDEYAPPEINDGVECVAWLARQPWSNGSIGMRGISWGGINSLQVAAMAPPALKAIMPMGCVDNRFLGDAHYIGGALAAENFKWGSYFKVYMGAPPDPQVSGADWETAWRERLEATPAILKEWTSHQRYDQYWQRGSIAADYSRIKCPVYVVGGWLDPYSHAVGTLLAGLKVPRKGLIGPWGHIMPNLPKPLSLDWAYEEVRWWQHWLQGVDTGIMDEPMLRAYMPYRTVSEVYPAEIPGRWVAEAAWPAPNPPLVLHLGAGTLSRAPARGSLTYVGDKIVGMSKPQWMPSRPADQRSDDLKSLVFDSEPLDAATEILGVPLARIRVGADVPVAKLAVRLTEVLPDGSSWLVSYGLLNLTHRDSHEHPSPLKPGELYDAEVTLYMVAHRFKEGSRIRLALSESLWPLVWPSPQIATLTIDLEGSSLVLPSRPVPGKEASFPIPVIHSAGSTPYMATETGGGTQASLESPLQSNLVRDVGTVVETQSSEKLNISEGQPNSAVWTQENMTAWKRDGWDCTVSAAFELSSTAEEFRLTEVLRAKKGDREIFKREQFSSIRRDLL
jgi:putative CocE/NonD family hydrolase